LLAADLPFLNPAAVDVLRAAADRSTVDVAMFVDDGGRRQLLCGVWRTEALSQRLAALGDSSAALAGLPVRRLVEGLIVAEVGWDDPGPPPWYDCDTESDLHRAREWT
jgi:molybdopterin-guanine dinucleotide biosynthesis protein A